MEETRAYQLMIDELPVDSFDWIRWRNFSIFDVFGIQCRTYSLLQNKQTIKGHSVGYIEGEKLLCRPKKDTIAVMFLVDDEFEWCHVTKKEFEAIFYET